MATFATTLPDDLLQMLHERAKALSRPKECLIENALRLYLEHLERAEYKGSFVDAAKEADIIHIAEEDMANYLKQLE